MADKYQTEDGRIFDNQSEAQNHANNLASDRASMNATDRNQQQFTAQIMAEDHNKIVRAFNAGNWAETIKAAEYENPLYHNFKKLEGVYADIWYMKTIARANSDPNFDCLIALRNANWGKPYERRSDDYRSGGENAKILHQELFKIGKRLWEKKNGRTMTDSDLNQLCASEIETEMAENVKKYDHSWDTSIFKWEKIVGRLMTEEDQKRIAGKNFKIMLNAYGSPDNKYSLKQLHSLSSSSSSSSSRSSTSSGDQRSIFLSIVFALVCGAGSFLTLKMIFNLLSGNGINIITIGAMIVGFIITFIAWRYKRNFLFVLMLVISAVGYLNLFGIIGNKTPKAKTETTQSLAITQQADIINNVNFRKDPSTGDNIIRQLKKGDTVTLTGETVEGWTQITHNGDTGWVSSEFLKVWGK